MVDRGPWPSSVGLLARQTRHQVAMFVRVPAAVFFTLALPVVILVVVNAVFGNGTALADGGEWPTRQFYTGALAAFTAVSATYTNVANMLPIRREEGVLTRSDPISGDVAAAVGWNAAWNDSTNGFSGNTSPMTSSHRGGSSSGMNTFDTKANGKIVALATDEAALAVGTADATAVPRAAKQTTDTTKVTAAAGSADGVISRP